MEGTGRGGDPLSVQNYVDIFCALGTQKKGKVKNKKLENQ